MTGTAFHHPAALWDFLTIDPVLFFAFRARNAGGVRDLSSLRLPSELQRLLHRLPPSVSSLCHLSLFLSFSVFHSFIVYLIVLLLEEMSIESLEEG